MLFPDNVILPVKDQNVTSDRRFRLPCDHSGPEGVIPRLHLSKTMIDPYDLHIFICKSFVIVAHNNPFSGISGYTFLVFFILFIDIVDKSRIPYKYWISLSTAPLTILSMSTVNGAVKTFLFEWNLHIVR